MTTDAQGKLDLAAGVAYLRSTEDLMLVALADIIETNKEYPTEEELTQILIFFLTFSMGCSEMKLPEIANNFKERANKFIVTLGKLGMHSGKTRNYVRQTWEPLAFNRILNRATAVVAYKAAGSVNTY